MKQPLDTNNVVPSTMQQQKEEIEGPMRDAGNENAKCKSSNSSNGYSSDRSSSGESSSSGKMSESDKSTTAKRTKKRRRRGRKHKVSPSSCPSPSAKAESEIADEDQDKYVAMDCEMVGIGVGGHKSALARVCIIDLHREVLLDTFVRVHEPVTDYRTFVSGITEDHLRSDSAMSFHDCRLAVQNILRGKILVGHALKNDLQCLRLSHPWHDTRDTAKYEPFMKCRFDDGILWPRKLKELTMERLQRSIQPDGEHHCPFEDANAALELYLNVRRKWEKVMEYKIRKTREIQSLQQHHHHHLVPAGKISPITTVPTVQVQ